MRVDCEEIVREFAAYVALRDHAGLGLRAYLDARQAALAGAVLTAQG